MTPMKVSFALLLLLTGSVLWSSGEASESSLTFELPYGQRKCFMDDLAPNGQVKGTVQVSSGKGEMSLDIFVSDSRGTVHFHKSDINSIKFSFAVPQQPHHDGRPETYRFCVVNQIHQNAITQDDKVVRKVTLRISYVSSEQSNDMSNLAKSHHAEKLFSTFSSVSSDVDQLIRALDDLRMQERQLTQLNESTSATILTISSLACLFTVLTGVLSFLSLKTFFKRKKLA